MPSLFIFLFGIFLQRHLDDLRRVLERRAAVWLTAEGWCLHGRATSYGVYLYHQLVVNLLLHRGSTGRWEDLALTVVATLALGVLSWQLIEAPALRHKRKPLRAAT